MKRDHRVFSRPCQQAFNWQNSLTMQMFWFIMADRLAAEKAKLESDLENERKSTVEKILLLQESESRLK